MSGYVGVFALMAAVPMWIIVLVALIIGVVIPFVIADRVSGLFFNYSYSRMIGNIGLLTVILIGVTVLERGDPLPAWFASTVLQTSWLLICIVVGILLVVVNSYLPIATWPDRYHNAVVVLLFLFFVPLAMLVIFNNGRYYEVVASSLLLVVWAAFGVYDLADDRIDQPARLEEQYGIVFSNEHFVRRP